MKNNSPKKKLVTSFLSITMMFGAFAQASAQDCTNPNWEVVASGLTNPRNVHFGPDGLLYVAEAGIGGDLEPTCEPADNMFQPYRGGYSARISKIMPDGTRQTVADGLPGFLDGFGDGLGVSDLAWMDGKMYALIEGGGCTRGLPNDPAGVVRINPDGSYTYVADITAFIRANPVAIEPECGVFGDCEPDGVPHSMIVHGDKLLVVETNHNSVLKVDPLSGTVTRVLDLSVQDPAPIILGRKGNNFFLAGFDGLIQTFSDTFGPVTTFDQDYSAIVNLHIRGNDMYALETFAPDTPWTPDTGRVIHRANDGTRTVIACGLNFPIGMTRRGNELFVSTASHGQGPVTGVGKIVRVRL
ncbi:MAG: ScyD/ScyE family protein [Pyrinomonadaceae bacterium]